MVSIALCDDENKYLIKYEKELGKILTSFKLNYELIKFHSGEELLENFTKNPHKFQIFILDIVMIELNGLNLADIIKSKNNEVDIIFLTNSENYVYDSFNVSPIGYLIKDKDDHKLSNLLEKIIKKRNYYLMKDDFNFTNSTQYFSFSNSEIIYFEILHRIVIIHLTKHRKHEFYITLKNLEKLLDINRYVKVYRSYIINMQYIKNISRTEIELKNGLILPVSRELFDDVRVKFSNYINEKLS